MDSLILRAAARIITPLQLAFSIFLLLRGHNEPGGGFIGGLVAACGISLHAVAHDLDAARRILRVAPRTLIGAGLLVGASSGMVGMFFGEPFMSAAWGPAIPTFIAGPLKLGTPLLFDLGVYLVVAGVALMLVFAMAEDE